jgi:hypothetical protein
MSDCTREFLAGGGNGWASQDFEPFLALRESNKYQLSLIHRQLKVGSANQRHPFSRQRFLLSRNSSGNRKINQWNKEQ